MDSEFLYDNIQLPSHENVSDILDQDFFIIEHVSADLLRQLTDPVKFSASASIFVRRGECQADISLVNYNITGPSLVNIRRSNILMPSFVSSDFDAVCVVLSKRMTEAMFMCINSLPAFNMATCHPVVEVPEHQVAAYEVLYRRLGEISAATDNEYIFQAQLYAMVQFFFQTGWHTYKQFVNDIPTPHGRIADRFMTLVRQNFKHERFLEFYANRLEITSKHLSRTIKAQTGVSAVEWIERFIVLEAKVLLKSSNLNIQQISDELHFPSQSFFGKYFKKKTGMSPKEFRNR